MIVNKTERGFSNRLRTVVHTNLKVIRKIMVPAMMIDFL